MYTNQYTLAIVSKLHDVCRVEKVMRCVNCCDNTENISFQLLLWFVFHIVIWSVRFFQLWRRTNKKCTQTHANILNFHLFRLKFYLTSETWRESSVGWNNLKCDSDLGRANAINHNDFNISLEAFIAHVILTFDDSIRISVYLYANTSLIRFNGQYYYMIRATNEFPF